MINENEILRERRERMEMHRRNLEDGSLKSYNKNEKYSSPIVFQSILCLFIFAFIVIMKLTNIDITQNLTLTLENQIEKDNLPQIMGFMDSAKSTFAFSPYENIESVDQKKENVSVQESDVNVTNEDITDEYPTTEFTIDENMLSDISEDNGLLEKK